MKKSLLAFLLFFISLTVFVSCSGGGGGDKEKYRVMVSVDGGATVTGENPKDVEEGSSATFDVAINSGYGFVSTSHGTYDPETGKLTVENVTERINISFVIISTSSYSG